MTPSEIKEARQSLGLSQKQMADMLDTDPRVIRSVEAPDGATTHRAPAVRVERLLRAYMAGYRPDDWP